VQGYVRERSEALARAQVARHREEDRRHYTSLRHRVSVAETKLRVTEDNLRGELRAEILEGAQQRREAQCLEGDLRSMIADKDTFIAQLQAQLALERADMQRRIHELENQVKLRSKRLLQEEHAKAVLQGEQSALRAHFSEQQLSFERQLELLQREEESEQRRQAALLYGSAARQHRKRSEVAPTQAARRMSATPLHVLAETETHGTALWAQPLAPHVAAGGGLCVGDISRDKSTNTKVAGLVARAHSVASGAPAGAQAGLPRGVYGGSTAPPATADAGARRY